MQGGGRSGHVMWLGLDGAVLALGLSRRSAAARTELRDAEDLLDAIEEAFNDRLQQELQQSGPGRSSHAPSEAFNDQFQQELRRSEAGGSSHAPSESESHAAHELVVV
jgi:hypothetical protein